MPKYQVTRHAGPWSHPMPLRKIHIKDIKKEPVVATGVYQITVTDTPEVREALQGTGWRNIDTEHNPSWGYLHFWTNWDVTQGSDSFNLTYDIEIVELVWDKPLRKVYIEDIIKEERDEYCYKIYTKKSERLFQKLREEGYWSWPDGSPIPELKDPSKQYIQFWLDGTITHDSGNFGKTNGYEEVEIVFKLPEKLKKNKPYNRFDYFDLE